MGEVDLATVRVHPWRKGSVLDCFILTSIWVGEWISGRKVISWDVKCTSGLNDPLQVNSLERKKAKNARVKAAQSNVVWICAQLGVKIVMDGSENLNGNWKTGELLGGG